MIVTKLRVWLALGTLLCLTSLSVHALPKLIDIRYSSLSDNQIELEFVFDEDVPQPATSVTNQPAAVLLSIDGTTSAVGLAEIPVNRADVEKIVVKERKGALELATMITQLRPYNTRLEGNKIYLQIGSEADKLNVDVASVADGSLNTIKKLDFRRAEGNEGRFIAHLDNSSIAVDVAQKAERIEAVFHDTDILDDLIYLMDVTDFGTPIESIDVIPEQGKTRFVVKPKGAYRYSYSQQGNVFMLSVNPVSEIELEQQRSYEGKPISLNFQDISVRTVLQIIADNNGFNLVTTDSVSGNITLRLDGVPWDQALDIILKVRGLGKRLDGNILLVAPSEELAIREAQELKARQEVLELAPLYSQYIQINYAKASDLAELMQNDSSNMLSERGSVAVDERTNTLLVRDTAAQLEELRSLVEVLDRPVRQVLIESRVVTVRDSVAEELGVRWGVTNTFDVGSGNGAVSGSLEALDNINGLTDGDLTVDDRLLVDLPAGSSSASTIAFQVAKLADGTLLDLELSALETENKGEIIASPRIMTANQKEAFIKQGVEIPYEESTSSGATSIEYKEAVLSLTVTPHITPDDRVILDLQITQDSQGEAVPTSGGGSSVAIDTQSISTQVLVENGETVVLGGIYQQEIINIENKVPILGDLPGVGWLFKSSNDQNEKREILIFVTPRIVTEEI